MNQLAKLIKEAKAFGSAACDMGRHEWESEGGRACPKETGLDCSQAVYVCSQCGEVDYGDVGGPGWKQCFVFCRKEDMTIEDPQNMLPD